jgi:hypothetical protein
MKTTVTVDEVMALQPCYTREKLEAMAAGRASMTLVEVCDLPVPAEDLLWLLLRPEFLPEPAIHALACNFAEHSLMRERDRGREPDARSWAAIETKRRWLRGEASDQDLAAAWSAAWSAARDAARSAAWSAARSAAWSAAWSAARDAAWDAARDAAWSAARSAARDAAWSAAWSAARDAEQKWQLQQVRSALIALSGDNPGQ